MSVGHVSSLLFLRPPHRPSRPPLPHSLPWWPPSPLCHQRHDPELDARHERRRAPPGWGEGSHPASQVFFQSLSSSRARAVPLLSPHWPVMDKARRVCVCRLQPRQSSISRELPPTLHALVSSGRSLWISRASIAAAADLHHTPAAPCSPRGGWRLSG
jgi:hypothetical protein